MKAIFLSILLLLTVAVKSQDYCSEVNVQLVTAFYADCQVEIGAIRLLADNAPELLRNGNCSVACQARIFLMKRYVGCQSLSDSLASLPIQLTTALRIKIFTSLDAKCRNDTDHPPLPVLMGGQQQIQCPPNVKLLVRDAIIGVLANCTNLIGGAMLTCDGGCLYSSIVLQKLLFVCKDDYTFIDDAIAPTIRDGLAIIGRACELIRRLDDVAQCAQHFNATLQTIQQACDGQVCSQTCQDSFMRNAGIITTCLAIFTNVNTVPIDDRLRDFVRRVRYLCGVRNLNLNVTVDPINLMINADAVDTLDPMSPRSNILIDIQARGVQISRFLQRNDPAPISKYRLRFRKLIEFTPRPAGDTDPDFKTNGFDPLKDTVEMEHDLDDTNNTSIDPINDFGSNDVDPDPSKPVDQQQGAGFQRVFRLSVRFGPLRLIRLIVSFVLSNVRNAMGLGQVNIPGGVNFNAVIDNVPFTKDGTHFAFAYDIESDVDLNITRNTGQAEQDPNLPNYIDNSETVISFNGVNDTRRLRYRRIVFCPDGNSLIIRERVVTVVENSITIRRVFITYFFSTQRCDKLLLDPALDNSPPDQPVQPVPPQTSQQGVVSSNGGNKSGKNSASFVCFSVLLLFVVSLMF